jgi:hypothetical protein
VHLLLGSLSCRSSGLVKPESLQLPLLLHTRSASCAPAATSKAAAAAADAGTEGCDGLLSLLELVAGSEVGVVALKGLVFGTACPMVQCQDGVSIWFPLPATPAPKILLPQAWLR